ncbi:unnamed protein product [Ectocarpus sp. 6 AP-2014]
MCAVAVLARMGLGLEALSLVWEEQEAGVWLEGANRAGVYRRVRLPRTKAPPTKMPMARSRLFVPLMFFVELEAPSSVVCPSTFYGISVVKVRL